MHVCVARDGRREGRDRDANVCGNQAQAKINTCRERLYLIDKYVQCISTLAYIQLQFVQASKRRWHFKFY